MDTERPLRLLLPVSLALAALFPRTAQARGRPTVATDAFMVGARLAPGTALTASWDLDVYLARSRAVSIGPGVSVSVLGSDASGGLEQDLLVGVDVVRLKIGVSESGGEWRPYLFVGGGFSYARLPAQSEDVPVRIGDDDEGDVAIGEREFPEDEQFVGMASFGAGADLFVGGPWALTFALVTHARLGDFARLPELWNEMLLGIRFGL